MANLINLNVDQSISLAKREYWFNQVTSVVAFSTIGVSLGILAAPYGIFWVCTACACTPSLYNFFDQSQFTQFRARAVNYAREWRLLNQVKKKIESGVDDVLLAQISVYRDKIQNALTKIQNAEDKLSDGNQSFEIQCRDYIHRRKEHKLLPHKIRQAYLTYLHNHRESPRPLSDIVAHEMKKSLEQVLIRHEFHNDDVYLKTVDGRKFDRADLLAWSVDQIRVTIFENHAA